MSEYTYNDEDYTAANEVANLRSEIERLLAMNKQLQTQCDRWRNIAMFQLTAIYGDDVQDHIYKCYAPDGTYHGGNQ